MMAGAHCYNMRLVNLRALRDDALQRGEHARAALVEQAISRQMYEAEQL